ncbi:hypothetical protein [Acetobacter nitrogenifigens]|uniref:Uncharacterized protein n=1 Tax=Acetobacter nitrogenifigens DSM 23921 = NBRC 105050 TaxID=1120919 RepID=A0A511X9V5_9PROT|nr:hypothetical protein [Acetobacter nitrogenifigens]GEN59736.1 hypothetical protein ANI02nite_16200 [Acetobacter nitrogenifigens DSM 23921 = NBRC 105050]
MRSDAAEALKGDDLPVFNGFPSMLHGKVAHNDIKKRLPPALQMQLGPSPDISGRIYALGGEDNFQDVPGEERKQITIDGDVVVELDLTASYLSVLPGMTGGIVSVEVAPSVRTALWA